LCGSWGHSGLGWAGELARPPLDTPLAEIRSCIIGPRGRDAV